ncbi:P-loop NTPase family protein, partial [Allocoprococcus similis]
YEDEDDFEDFEDDEDDDEDDYQIDDELDEDHKEDFDFEKESDLDDNDSDEDDSDFADLDSFEDEEELDSSDDYLDLEFDEEPTPAPEPKKETSKSEPTPDIDEVLEIEEPSEDEITERMGKFDTGFVVQGRYDLSATSEIGLKLGLTEEQKQLFSYFVPIRGVSEQLVEVLDNDKRCRNRYGTSRTGNILILGRKGSGKTVLAVDIVKAIQKQRRLKQGKVAIVTGDSLNKKDIGSIIDKLNGGALIIEKASKMNDRTIRELNDMMDEQTGELLFLLEDQKKPLERMFASHREFKRKFTSRLELPVFINDELVTFGQTYAKENGYRIDEMGILALYSRIDMMQREDHAVTVAEVKEIMDEAILHSQKANVKHLVKRVFGRSTDNSDHIILKEEDFKA